MFYANQIVRQRVTINNRRPWAHPMKFDGMAIDK
jgi:hypothetical protein